MIIFRIKLNNKIKQIITFNINKILKVRREMIISIVLIIKIINSIKKVYKIINNLKTIIKMENKMIMNLIIFQKIFMNYIRKQKQPKIHFNSINRKVKNTKKILIKLKIILKN